MLGLCLNGILFDHIIYFCNCRGSQYHFLSHNAASVTNLEIQGVRKKDEYIHVQNICTSIWQICFFSHFLTCMYINIMETILEARLPDYRCSSSREKSEEKESATRERTKKEGQSVR